jgi:hypothetical protein
MEIRKDRPPYSKASPESATIYDGYFADSRGGEIEARVETRLAHEIEDPVNQFIFQFLDPAFVLTDAQRRRMTRHVTLLFNRSMACRISTKHREEIKVHAVRQFLADEGQQATGAAQWNIDAYFNGMRLGSLITIDDMVRAVRRLTVFSDPASSEQESYVTGIARFMTYFDEAMFYGDWRLVGTTRDNPFILSDAPVVTWDRKDSTGISHGIGFEEPNVEILLPVSPLTCLHILPRVQRTRPVVAPQVEEVNIAQAKFAHRGCFANQNKTEIDNVVQRHISTAKLGENAFTLWNRNYDNLVCDILMNMKMPAIAAKAQTAGAQPERQ